MKLDFVKLFTITETVLSNSIIRSPLSLKHCNMLTCIKRILQFWFYTDSKFITQIYIYIYISIRIIINRLRIVLSLS